MSYKPVKSWVNSWVWVYSPDLDTYYSGYAYHYDSNKKLYMVTIINQIPDFTDTDVEHFIKKFKFEDNDLELDTQLKSQSVLGYKGFTFKLVNQNNVYELPKTYNFVGSSNTDKHWFDQYDIGRRYPDMLNQGTKGKLKNGQLVYVSLPYDHYLNANHQNRDNPMFGEVIGVVIEKSDRKPEYLETDEYSGSLKKFCALNKFDQDAYIDLFEIAISIDAIRKFNIKVDDRSIFEKDEPGFFYVPYGAIKIIPANVRDIHRIDPIDTGLPLNTSFDNMSFDTLAQILNSKEYKYKNMPPPPPPVVTTEGPTYIHHFPSNKSDLDTPIVSQSIVSQSIVSQPTIRIEPIGFRRPTVLRGVSSFLQFPFRTKGPRYTQHRQHRQYSRIVRIGGYKQRKKILHSKKPNNISRRRKSIKIKMSRKSRKYKKQKTLNIFKR